ncbi:MAG TPA: ECF-type sigma factor [Bryobacteraceae bacterium]|nr:ECF-type sigma factor [Bryobacteraceae bacterium]
MQPEEQAPITVLLSEWRDGDPEAGRRVVSVVYRELRRLAAVYLSREGKAFTLQPTALVNELCVGMLSRAPVSCENRLHFLHVASQQMRRLIVDHSRRRKGLKRGGDQVHLSLDEARDHAIPFDERIRDLDEALTKLEQLDPRPASVVEMRFFGGLTEQEIADILGISVASVKREWEFARSWLLAQLERAE